MFAHLYMHTFIHTYAHVYTYCVDRQTGTNAHTYRCISHGIFFIHFSYRLLERQTEFAKVRISSLKDNHPSKSNSTPATPAGCLALDARHRSPIWRNLNIYTGEITLVRASFPGCSAESSEMFLRIRKVRLGVNGRTLREVKTSSNSETFFGISNEMLLKSKFPAVEPSKATQDIVGIPF